MRDPRTTGSTRSKRLALAAMAALTLVVPCITRAIEAAGFPAGQLGNPLIGPGIVSVDASANKRFTISGGTYAELRIEVFNVGNHPIWCQPGNTLRTPTFGVITNTRMDSRQVQIGMKLVF